MSPPACREAEAGDAAGSNRASSRVSSGGDTVPFDHERFARMRAHAAFVPTLVLERLAADPRAPAEPYETSFPAAVMFVDIAGYVRLSGATHRSVARRETRMEVQSRGLRRKRSGRWRRRTSDDANPDSRVAGLAGEAMRDVVSACFAAIVEMVSRHGGDVVKFAGDALFVAWPAGPDRREDRSIVRPSRTSREEEDDENETHVSKKEKTPATRRDETLGETALRAVQCGLAIQASAHEALKDLRLKLVIGAGRLRGLNVGGVDDRWEYAVAGEPVSQIARCARFAAPGEVVVSPECARLEEMQDHAETEPVWGPSVGSDEEDDASSDDGSASENDADHPSSKTKKSVSVRAFRFPSARLLVAGALETLGAFAGDASFAAGASRSRAPWSRASSGTSTRSRRSHRSRTDRESNGSNRTPNPEPLRVARLTNGFDGATVAAAAPPRPSADRDAMLRDVLRLFRGTRNDKMSGPDIRQAPVDPADALVKALERYVPAPARFGGCETKRGEAKTNVHASSARVGADADRRTPRVSRLYDVAWRGEIRRCAVVFLDARLPEIPASFCDGADADGTNAYDGTNAEFSSESAGGEEALLRHAQTAVASIQNSLKTHGGALRQFLVDDKGSVAIAVFGLPSMSHADDARRAVAFAAEVVAALEAGGLAGGRAGIATGDAFCGAVGPETRCEYAVYGDCVNVAARLMTLSSRSDVSGSKSSVLACESTRDACGDAVAFDAGTPVRLKGKKGTTLAFAPLRGGSRRRGDDVATDALGFERRPFASNRPRWTRTRRGDGIGPIGRTSTSSVRLDIDALEPRARGLVVTAAAFSEAFDAETLLAAAAGVADSCSRGENDETSAGSPPRDFATRDDVDALVRAGIFRVTSTAERKRAEDPCSSDSSEDSSDASVSRVTVSFASPDDSAPENEKRRSVIASGENKRRGAVRRDTERASLAFASGGVRDAALSMLTDAARRPASRAVASHLESSLNQETRNALRAQKKKRAARVSASLAPDAATTSPPNAFFEDAALLADVAAHWTAAGRRARARRCLALAGEKELARGTRGAALRAAGLFAEALRLCEPPSPSERRLSDSKKSLSLTLAQKKKRLRRYAFLARRAGAARRAAGHGDAAERLVRDTIDTLEASVEEDGARREGNACACARVSALLFRAKPGSGPANRTRFTKKKTRGRMTKRDATETDFGKKNGNVSPGTSSSSTDSSYDSAEANAELALARLALFEITGATADAARAVRAAEACEGNAAASLFSRRTDGNENDATKRIFIFPENRAEDALRDARVAVADTGKRARRKSAFFSFTT